MQESNETGLQKLTDTIGDLVTGIPTPLKKNFIKAFGQLCTAAVDIPVAWLQGKASEIRATTEARIQIIKKEGEGITREIEVPKEYILKASSKYASKIIKEQINLDEITLNAAKELSATVINVDDEFSKEIEDDWLNEFESHARLKSSDDMKVIFGKILSGEIRRPGTFSIRTIRLLSQLDNDAAKLFQLLCSLSVSRREGTHISDARVLAFEGSAASNALRPYGLSFDNLNILQEHGLIIPDFNSWRVYSTCIANEDNLAKRTLYFNKKHYILIPTDKYEREISLRLHGVAFTKAALELLDIIPINRYEIYENGLIDFFTIRHLQLKELP